jgi:pSer/pThr/pTyr-binding forkhead associated (FHA) protein
MVGAYMWKLSIEDDQGQSTVVQLVRNEYSIGRTEENTIRLTERNISRNHAKLFKQGAGWFLDDHGSYNGCFVNGARVTGNHPVNVNDLIQLGDYRLELYADEAEAQAAIRTSPPRPETLSTTLNLATQTDRLVMVVGPTPGREFHLTHGSQRIGRGEECEISVNHSSVSRWHADVNFIGSGRYEVVDHGSSNGIRINGVELARGLLDARDLVELGDVVLKFIPEGQLYRPTPEESRQLAALLGVDTEGPPPSTTERVGFVWKSMSKATRWGTFLLGLIVIVLLVFVVANRKLSLLAEPPASAISNDPHVNTLKEAQTHFARSDLETAHRLLQSIPETSNVRLEPNFRLIEEKWALSLISKAETGPEDERQKLLETVSQTTTVERATRNRAADLLAKLKAEAVDVAALPSMLPKTASSPEASSDSLDAPPTNAEVASNATQPANSTTLKRSLSTHNAVQSDVSMTRPVTTSSGQKGAASPASSPSEPNAADLATSGNLDSARTARDALKRKVAAGTASEREKRLLRALCRQLGDNTCSR